MLSLDILRFITPSLLFGAVLAAPTAQEQNPVPLTTGPELIVVLHSAPAARIQEVETSAPAPNPALLDVLKKHNAGIAPVFEPVNTTERRLRVRDATGSELPDLSIYFKVDAPESQLETIAKEIRETGQVSGAYVRPGFSQPVMHESNTVARKAIKRQSSPDFTSRQGYLAAAPEGINAAYGNAQPGGLGEGVKVVDVEQGFRFGHEDLILNQGGVIHGNPNPDNNHGTAVTGMISGDVNSFGITGISPNAMIYGSSYWDNTVAAAIQAAVDILGPGDIILLEVQSTGPTGSYIAVEWFPDILAVVKYATAHGIIVVEAAGNDNQNLDSAAFDQPRSGFPADWKNPFNSSNPSSGAVMVGAGAPPPDTHNGTANYGPDRSRLDFSNYGSRIDAQGWGRGVTSSGYGDLYNGGTNAQYTDVFSGTSSASPIVTGSLAVVMGILKQSGKRITSEQARSILRSTGSPQQAGNQGPVTGQRIGNRPNLVELIPAAQAIAII